MKRLLKIAAVLSSSALFVGCLQVQNNVKVKPDGSGTVELTVTMKKDTIQQIKAMTEVFTKMGGEPAAGQKPFEFFDEEKLKQNAAQMGEGVTYISGKKISDAQYEGFTAVYAFTDINKLKLSRDPEAAAPENPMGGVRLKQRKKADITFQFTKGDTAKLVIKLVEPPPPAPAEAKPKGADDPAAEMQKAMADMVKPMLKPMLGGMKFNLTIELDGTIVQTNATHCDGNKITLVQLDFDKVIEDDAAFKKLMDQQEQEPDFDKVIQLWKGLPGCKVEENKEVTIEFK